MKDKIAAESEMPLIQLMAEVQTEQRQPSSIAIINVLVLAYAVFI